MNQNLRQAVRLRAGSRCEYCEIHERHSPFAAFHLDHIVARQHGGKDEEQNLAWSCHDCNLQKGPNLSSVDPDTGEVVRLFNPRTQKWNDHFLWENDFVRGQTPSGRATVWLLQLNAPERLELRAALRSADEK